MLTRAEIIEVNRLARLQDKLDSKLWPVRGRFSVAERAIRKARALIREGLEIETVDQYETLLAEVSAEIVNNPKNW